MNEREFWIQIRRLCLGLAAAIERRYDIRAGEYGPCVEMDVQTLFQGFLATLAQGVIAYTRS